MSGYAFAKLDSPVSQAFAQGMYTSGYAQNAMIEGGHLGGGALLLAKPRRKIYLARMTRRAPAG